MNIYYEAAIWIGMALLASVVSVQIAVPVALVEIVVGALAGNIAGISSHVTQTAFVTFLAGVGSIALTFLAGAEIDPVSLRRHWKASLSIAGLVIAGGFMHDRVLLDRLRSIAFALLTPFFFLRAGTLIHASALVSGAGVIAVLLAVKLISKGVAVWPTAARFRLQKRERAYTTLLMATGLTFGSIAALFGLTHNLINSTQYTELVTVVVLSAFVPTLIAQQVFQPELSDADEGEAEPRDEPVR